MNDQEKRIKLAEAMYWKRVTLKTLGGEDSNVWESPTGTQSADSLPDPFTDANHCDALIKHLTTMGIFTNVYQGHQDRVRIFTDGKIPQDDKHWSGDDWKQGVCELALKVIDA